MLPTLILDTDILIDHVRGDQIAHRLLLSIEKGEYFAHYSTITESELHAGKRMRRRVERRRVEQLLSIMQRVELTVEMARRGGEMRRNFGTELPNALIAATALNIRGRLVTRNLKHYADIQGLALTTPGNILRQSHPQSNLILRKLVDWPTIELRGVRAWRCLHSIRCKYHILDIFVRHIVSIWSAGSQRNIDKDDCQGKDSNSLQIYSPMRPPVLTLEGCSPVVRDALQ